MFDAIPTVTEVLGAPLAPETQLIILALAATRIAGLVALDAIFDTPRGAVTTATDRRGSTRWIGYLVNCMWCVGVWTGAAATAMAMWSTTWAVGVLFDWTLIVLAVAQVTGMLSGVGRN